MREVGRCVTVVCDQRAASRKESKLPYKPYMDCTNTCILPMAGRGLRSWRRTGRPRSSSERQEDMNPDHLIMAALFALLLIYGPNKLTQLGNALGKTVKNVRDGMDGVGDDETAIAQDSATDADRQ